MLNLCFYLGLRSETVSSVSLRVLSLSKPLSGILYADLSGLLIFLLDLCGCVCVLVINEFAPVEIFCS